MYVNALGSYGYGNTFPRKAQKVVSWILRLLDAWNEVKHILPNGGLKFNGDLPRVPNAKKSP